MDLGIAGRRALVTAAGRGIGRACAVALAREGARVTVCARTAADLDGVLTEMGGAEAGHSAVVVDLVADDGPRRLLEAIPGAEMPELVVHNLGGTLGVNDPLAPLDDWRRVWRVNLEVAIELDAAIIPSMRERGDGRIVYISSLAAFEHHGAVPYAVVKAALTAYARGLGRTLAKDGVIVTAVVPGVIFSEGNHWDNARKRDPEYVEYYLKERVPRGAFGTPEEVASAVTFLCSRNAGSFHGSIVPLDGGMGRSYFGQ